MKAFIFDASICNGCHGCQIACKDEHCEQDWHPYAAPQPLTGQFWCKCDEEEFGKVPFVHVNYTVHICANCDDCKALELAENGGAYRREDGIVILDPDKCKGQKQIADACPNIYWNEELQIPQKCTGCAHLLDDGWDVPRCVDWCPTGALQFGEESELDLTGCEPSTPGGHFYYKNLPGRRISGTVADRSINEVIIGAKVTITDTDGAVVGELLTDEFGDFQFKQASEGEFDVTIAADGYEEMHYHVTTVDNDAVVGQVFVTPVAEEETEAAAAVAGGPSVTEWPDDGILRPSPSWIGWSLQ